MSNILSTTKIWFHSLQASETNTLQKCYFIIISYWSCLITINNEKVKENIISQMDHQTSFLCLARAWLSGEEGRCSRSATFNVQRHQSLCCPVDNMVWKYQRLQFRSHLHIALKATAPFSKLFIRFEEIWIYFQSIKCFKSL